MRGVSAKSDYAGEGVSDPPQNKWHHQWTAPYLKLYFTFQNKIKCKNYPQHGQFLKIIDLSFFLQKTLIHWKKLIERINPANYDTLREKMGLK